MRHNNAHRLIVILIISISFLGCVRETKSPIDTLLFDNEEAGEINSLIIFLPGRYSSIEDYKKNGLIDAVQSRGLHVDMVVADAHLGYYKERNLIKRLREDIILPAKANGYDQIWFVGISMGGLGSLLYAMEYTDEIAGIVLMGPFLGYYDIIQEIDSAGGIENWDPGINLKDDSEHAFFKRMWLWLKKSQEETENIPIIYLGYGENDRYALSHEILATLLPSGQVVLIDGDHNLKTWLKLWDIMLNKLYF